MIDHDDETPPLHPIRTERIPNQSWVPASMELLPAGWVNVRMWPYDWTLGCDLYETEPCPGILHLESSVTETVVQDADPDGELFNEFGDPYDDSPIVVGIAVADSPHKWSQHVDPTWNLAHLGGGYIGTCRSEDVQALLTEHGFADALPRGDR